MNDKPGDKPAASVAIRLLDVIDGDAARLEPIARCPRQDRSIDARRCVTCARMRSMSWDPAAGGEVLCTAPSPASSVASPRADIAEAAARKLLHEIVAPVTRCITKETPLASVRALFADTSIACLPVVDGVMQFAGIVTRADLVGTPLDGLTADLPTRGSSLPEHAPIGYAIALMASERADHVAVVTDDGDLIGVWSAIDALRWVAERMGYVLRDEREAEKV